MSHKEGSAWRERDERIGRLERNKECRNKECRERERKETFEKEKEN